MQPEAGVHQAFIETLRFLRSKKPAEAQTLEIAGPKTQINAAAAKAGPLVPGRRRHPGFPRGSKTQET
jgi:hypothetical protein